jgi:hypothetical protein
MKGIILLLLYFISFKVAAQDTLKSFYNTGYKARSSGSFSKETRLLSFSYGFPTKLENAGYFEDMNFHPVESNGFGPLILRHERAILDELGISASFAFLSKKWKSLSGTTVKANAIGLGVLANYHFSKLIPSDRFDLFLAGGVQVVSGKWQISQAFQADFESKADTRIKAQYLVGARYYPFQHVGIFAEFGDSGLYNFDLGITFRSF